MATSHYWLIKSEPNVYPYSQLEREGKTSWTGVRNFEARNNIRAMRPGDLYASGTISGSTPDSLGSFIELTWNGARPIELPTGERRAFLEDGDEVTLSGWCEREGTRVLGFGSARGEILPAR